MKYLITGITGFLGTNLTRYLLKQNHEIIGISHSDKLTYEFKKEFPNVEIITGDICDRWTIRKAMKGVDGVFHLAALKNVDKSEIFAEAYCMTNIIGTLNVLKESMNIKPEFVILISTDKARQISSVYGATKFLGEKLFKEAGSINKDTKYRVVVYGNVLYSTGSVLCKWKEKMEKGEKIQVTDTNMTRFYWTVDQAIEHIFECISNAKDSTPYIPKMKSIKMKDLIDAMMIKYGRVELEIIGNRGGENIHETLGNGIWSNTVESYTIKEILKLI
jgi:FlaA1/EpsC-like NDP-sugar epimerase